MLRICKESGALPHFDARDWLNTWLNEEVPALGFQRPTDVLREFDGLERVKGYLPLCKAAPSFDPHVVRSLWTYVARHASGRQVRELGQPFLQSRPLVLWGEPRTVSG